MVKHEARSKQEEGGRKEKSGDFSSYLYVRDLK
jgi:hypothetical protein